MSDGRDARVAGRAVGLASCAIVVLLIRIATDGTFRRLDLNLASPAWILVTTAGILVTLVAAVLAVSLALRPRLRLLWPALFLGAIIVPFALVLLSIGHESAPAVAGLGLVIVAIAVYMLFLVKPRVSGR